MAAGRGVGRARRCGDPARGRAGRGPGCRRAAARRGADPAAGDAAGVTALHAAAAAGRGDVVELLLARGVFVDQAEFDGDTALANASALGHEAVVRILLAHGADPSIPGSRGDRPIQLARQGRHGSIVRLLREAEQRPVARTGAVPIAPDQIGRVLGGGADASARVYRPGYRRRVAAVVGINDYRHWPRLKGARRDAEKVAARLRAMGFDTVHELYDREATREAILELLGSRLPAEVGADDLVVIFFAGHGETEVLDADGTRKRGSVIPADATVESPFATAIPMPKLRELTSRLEAKHVYYAMDSCYSGLGFTRGLGVVDPRVPDYIEKVTSLRAVQMVTAGGEGEEAIEREGEGVFTRSFLDALDGAADANGDGYVTATEIGAYVAPRVTNETGARQSPQSGRLEGEGEIAFEVRPGG
ncbi:MAG: caspase family protein [Myxococcota bacterium]